MHPNWKSLDNLGTGKKSAISTAIQQTGADIILTTDADCQLQEHWVRNMCLPFRNASIQLVAGPVMSSHGPGFFAQFQQIDWAGILLLTCFMFSRRQALLCSGANLAYRKSAFEEVDGYAGNETFASGDDEFLLKKIIQEYGKNAVLYLHGGNVMVKTRPLERWGEFVQQRVRWASKWRLHQSIFHGFTAFITYLFAFLQMGSLFLLSGNRGSISILVLFWAIKMGMERKALGTVFSSFSMNIPLYSYLITSFLHPGYILLVGPLAILGKYSWKGRRYNSQS
jgi:cellulose synthase/poly-beta-1,6-N-acetylglucosamine synthase-like glycosyltransferase